LKKLKNEIKRDMYYPFSKDNRLWKLIKLSDSEKDSLVLSFTGKDNKDSFFSKKHVKNRRRDHN